ncbi:hypothetical protein BJX61DRAFT_533961 [Aspergillus egyptiacus]|nr:hypothetical protein BJX61DRAFT_533961 [Aspergillus egyptiacus]
MKLSWTLWPLSLLAPDGSQERASRIQEKVHGCPPAAQSVRRECKSQQTVRGSLSASERLDYIDALHCMRSRPPVLPQDQYPGVRHRMDDFSATHINYTLQIHLSGIFFGWHRHFVWLWEKALRDECGYRGHQPYWDWALSADNLSASPLFDGSPTSLSGDGVPIDHGHDHDAEIRLLPTNITIPQGSGGGCVTTGPFANMTLNLPDLSLAGDETFPPNAFAYSPHCFTRNLNSHISRAFTSQTDVDRLLTSASITELQANIDFSAWPELRQAGIMGPHAAAHMSLGRTMDDFWTAPQDPSFFLHHAQVDRIWTLWQARGSGEEERQRRRWALNGTSSIHNAPTTDEVTLDTQLAFGWLDHNRTLREVMSTQAYHFCYRYGD